MNVEIGGSIGRFRKTHAAFPVAGIMHDNLKKSRAWWNGDAEG